MMTIMTRKRLKGNNNETLRRFNDVKGRLNGVKGRLMVKRGVMMRVQGKGVCELMSQLEVGGSSARTYINQSFLGMN